MEMKPWSSHLHGTDADHKQNHQFLLCSHLQSKTGWYWQDQYANVLGYEDPASCVCKHVKIDTLSTVCPIPGATFSSQQFDENVSAGE